MHMAMATWESEERFDETVLRRRVEDQRDRRTFQKVFDADTLDTVHLLATRGLFDVLEHIVSTGKEAHVFVARDSAGNKRAVKIYKKETSNFKKMGEYIIGDRRFEGLGRDKRQMVFAWCRKEFKNLSIAANAGLPVPLPIGSRKNVLVMEFIGDSLGAAPRLRDTKPTIAQLEKYRQQIAGFMAGLYLAGLVHADLSEYNILVNNGKPVVIDMGQAVLLKHQNAKDFFERDVWNMANYFTKHGMETSEPEMLGMVRAERVAIDKMRDKAGKGQPIG